jgi:O-succinylbenzoate synthase
VFCCAASYNATNVAYAKGTFVKIESITARELRMHLKEPFETSSSITRERRVLLLEVRSEGLSGWGEITVDEDPFYNSETTDTAWHILRDFIVPLTLGKMVETAQEASALMSRIRGHEMARAGLENALWDIEAQQKGVPLHRLLGGSLADIPCGVSLGIQPTLSLVISKIEHELAAGYQRIKLKIKPGNDVRMVKEVRKILPNVKLMVDANSAYALQDTELLREFDSCDLLMIEQPLAWDELYEHAKLQLQIQTPICLDECIHNARHVCAAIELGACKVINVKLGRVGGHSEAKRVHDVCRERTIPVWCGGMLESGIGRVHNIAMSTLPGFTLPGDVSASRRYWDEDIIEPEVEVTTRGTIEVSESPGLGYSVRREHIQRLTVHSETWRA